MMAAEQAVGDYVKKLRVVEIGYSKKVRKLGILTNLARELTYCTPLCKVFSWYTNRSQSGLAIPSHLFW